MVKELMVSKVFAYLGLLAAALVFSACGGETGSGIGAEKEEGKLVIALKPDKNPDQMMEERKSLEQFLSSELGGPVEVIIPISGAVINEGFSNGTVDLGYLSANDLINAKDAELLLVGEINGQTTYKSYWLALRDKPYDSVEDLKGKPIAFASKTSTSGFVVPLWDLRRKGLVSDKNDPEEFFGKENVFYGTGYVSAVERVLNGQAEAAAVSYYVLDEDKHLSADQRAKLKKVAEQGDVPTHIIAIRSSISAAERAKIKEALLKLNQNGNTGLRDRMFTSKLVEADQEAHLRPLKEALVVVKR
jgi:phosphonate transport system substrate-binding protein